MANVPDVCTLPIAERPARTAEFDDLFARSVYGAARPDPLLLRLTLDGSPETEEMAAGLTEREKGCCAFFDFTLTRTGGDLRLDIRVPRGYVEVLDGLAARAAAVSGGQR